MNQTGIGVENQREKEIIRFDGKVAIVTGAGAGLGRVYALELAKRGARVVVNDLGSARDGSGHISTAPADMVVLEIKNLGVQAVPNYDSVASPEGGAAIVQTALDAFGTVDILINNAGIIRDKSFVKMEPDNWKAVIDVHLNGAFHVCRPAFEVMREKGYGRILMISSASGIYGNFGQANYAAAKMGIVGLMNALKIEGEKYNIKVNALAPLAASRMTEDILPPELLQKMKPEFVAPMALYLCSDSCPVNGAIYNAGMGFFSRAVILTGNGVHLNNGDNPPTPEQLRTHWHEINDLTQTKEICSLAEVFTAMMNS
jgi:NAD(P)-dependent dehydrogenase (short-subunit alcohol dehydrogenase family)